MPRFESIAPAKTGIPSTPATVFETVAAAVKRSGRRDVIRLHLGDAHARPSAKDTDTGSDFASWPLRWIRWKKESNA